MVRMTDAMVCMSVTSLISQLITRIYDYIQTNDVRLYVCLFVCPSTRLYMSVHGACGSLTRPLLTLLTIVCSGPNVQSAKVHRPNEQPVGERGPVRHVHGRGQWRTGADAQLAEGWTSDLPRRRPLPDTHRGQPFDTVYSVSSTWWRRVVSMYCRVGVWNGHQPRQTAYCYRSAPVQSSFRQ